MTTETKKYAIRCETQEQAREVVEYMFNNGAEKFEVSAAYYHNFPMILYNTDQILCCWGENMEENMKPYCSNIITYEEAVGLGLLGEKLKEVAIENDIIYQMDSYDKEEVKEESKIDISDKPDMYQLGFERGRQVGYKEGWKSAMQEIDDIYVEQQKRKHLNK